MDGGRRPPFEDHLGPSLDLLYAPLLALSQTTENRKVEARKPLIFRDPIFRSDRQNPTLRQSHRAHARDAPPGRTLWREDHAGHHGASQRCGVCPASAETAAAEIRAPPGAPAAPAVRKTLRTAASAKTRGDQEYPQTCTTGARLAHGTPTAYARGAAWAAVLCGQPPVVHDRQAPVSDCGGAHVHHRVLDMSVPQPILHERDIRTGVQQMHRNRVATLIVTLLIIRRWPRSGTRTIPSADKQWRLSAGYGASPRRVSSSSCLMASRSPLPRGCLTPSLVVSSKMHLPPA